MRYLILIMIMSSCGQDYCRSHKEDCHGEKGDTGTDGARGTQGVPGRDGTAGPVGARGVQGTTGAQGPAGNTGPSGAAGSVGPQGAPGTSCTVSQAVNGALISCTDGTHVVLLNGQDGMDAAPTPYTVTSLYDPCGQQTTYDEVLLRLANGSLLAHYSSGNQQFLTVIGPGSYVTTDGSSCYFTINNDLSISGEHN